MKKVILLGNAFSTLPFGVLTLVSPQLVFQGFEIALDPAGVIVAKGYAAACIGFGLLNYLFRNAEAQFVSKLMIASIAFNLIEAAIQLEAAVSKNVGSAIWVTIVLHAGLAALSIGALGSKHETD